jgi:hypothetical protein
MQPWPSTAVSEGARRTSHDHIWDRVAQVEKLIDQIQDDAPVPLSLRRPTEPKADLGWRSLLNRRLGYAASMIFGAILLIAGLALGLKAGVERHLELRDKTKSVQLEHIDFANAADTGITAGS